MQHTLAGLLSLLLFLQPFVALGQQDDAILRYNERHHPVLDSGGMVASQSATATEVGAAVLAQGGNAVDAAVAVGFALAVTLPRAGNIGGGGFMLVHLGETGETVALDYREMAPPRATRDMFLDADGNVDPERSRFSHLASGVPGTVAGLHAAHDRYGSLPWRELLQPAIRLAHDGIIVSHDLAGLLAARRERLGASEASLRYFYKDDGSAYAPGERLRQRDLARTLRLIARQGPDAFYRGDIADLIVAEMERNGGLIDAAALAAYRPVFREPVIGSYRGHDIVSMPPSSSGGVHIIQMLNVLEHFPVAEYGPGSADSVHLLTEVMKLAYADRSKHLGDMDYYDVPLDWLTSKDYGAELARGIDMASARPSADIAAGTVPPAESPDTTHFSIMDGDGNAVANTYTLNFSYGSGISVPGAGFLLNNEMDDFAAKPGVPNAFGLIGGEANAVQPGKRPLSSMTPALVLKDGRPWLATGSPGGSRIITSVLQMLVNVIDHGMNIADATATPRIHHQWLPDELQLESGFSPDTVAELRRRGHNVTASQAMGSLQSVMRGDELFRGASDPRRPGAGSAGPAMHTATH
ncbi:MAG: gamma-glutamyltransferase [Woeseiaceae bacterium]|nr:gamma-glutamyltransferase [Woeseiaceae bacterium]